MEAAVVNVLEGRTEALDRVQPLSQQLRDEIEARAVWVDGTFLAYGTPVFGWVGMNKVYMNRHQIASTRVAKDLKSITREEALQTKVALLEQRGGLAVEGHPPRPAGPPPAEALVDPATGPDAKRHAQLWYDFVVAVLVAHEMSHLLLRLALRNGNVHTPDIVETTSDEPQFVPETGNIFETRLCGGVLDIDQIEPTTLQNVEIEDIVEALRRGDAAARALPIPATLVGQMLQGGGARRVRGRPTYR